MAKSLRSKRKRKVRAEKRIVNAKKELVKLKQVAAKLHGTGADRLSKETIEAEMPDVTVIENQQQVETMSVDGEVIGKKGKINNQWMNQRRIKSIKNKIKKHNQKKARRGKPSGKARKGIK